MEAEHGKSTDVGKGRVRTVALSKPVGLRRTLTECRAIKDCFPRVDNVERVGGNQEGQ